MFFTASMRNAVLQTVLISLAYNVFYHYFARQYLHTLWQDKSFRSVANQTWGLTQEYVEQRPPFTYGGFYVMNPGPVKNATAHGFGTAQNMTAYNATAHNATVSPNAYGRRIPESFYGRKLPRGIVIVFIVSSLQYWWYIRLEKMFPARPRYKAAVPPQAERYEKLEESEDREEEVVKKWLAQGKVRRASLNWCNTFLKWAVDLTIGNLWQIGLLQVLTVLFTLQPPRKILGIFSTDFIIDALSYNFSFIPLCKLLAFIVAPAHKQLVFINSVEFVLNVFTTMALNATLPALARSNWGQDFMANMTRSQQEGKEYQRWKMSQKLRDSEDPGKEL